MAEVLDYLREQFDRLDLKLDRLTADLGEIRQRLTTLEIQGGGFVATEQSHYGQTMLRLDRFGDRLDRIERRLDLASLSLTIPHNTAILLTLSGWTSPRIAEAFSVREDTVRLWRSDFSRGGIDTLKRASRRGRRR